MTSSVSVLLVGHCGPDSWSLKMAVGRMLPEAKIEFVPDQKSLDRMLDSADLLLINRVLEEGFDAQDGIDLIRKLVHRGAEAKLMLISNYPEAQAEAAAAGAAPGFGKAEMNTGRARGAVLTALGLAGAKQA